MKLTALLIKNQKEPCRLADGGGLSFEITSSGLKRWLYRYRLAGRQRNYIIGRYPEISLSEAREMHREARALVGQGLSPVVERRVQKEINIEKTIPTGDLETTFKAIAYEWIARQRSVWSHDHAESVKNSLKKDVFGPIGNKQIDTITTPEILSIIRHIESRGSLEMAKKALQRTTAVFRYAVQTGLCTYNPAAEMRGVLQPRKVNHMPALYDNQLKRLVKDIASSPTLHLTTKLALQFACLTACRSAEVRGAEWSEIDEDKRLWLIPAARMKMSREHYVPLSRQAVSILERAGKTWGKDGLIFPSIRDATRPMSDNAMSKALRDMGYQGKATPHGFRSSFSTMAAENGFQPEIIEKALAHEESNRVKGAYNRAEYLEQRRDVLQWWGDVIQGFEIG